MKEPKVLIVTPIYKDKDYCLDLHLDCINKIKYTNTKQIFIDNSAGHEYTKTLINKGLEAYHVNRGNNSREAICNSMNFAREYFIKHNYDYMLVVESDLLPDPQIISRLLAYYKPVVGSYYLLGFKKDTDKMQDATIKLRNKEISDNEYRKRTRHLVPEVPCLFVLNEKKEDSGFIGTRILTIREGFDVFGTGLRRIHGCGLGATLIRKDIIKRFPFWYDDRFENKHHDVYFYMDLHNNNIPVYVDTNVLIKHRPSKWNLVNDM